MDIDLDRLHVEEEVAVVAVGFRNIHFGLLATAGQALLHGHDIIDISLLDLQDGIQGLRAVNRVAGPLDVAEIVFLALVDDEIDAEAVGIDIVDRIPDQTGIAVTSLVESADKTLLVVGIFLLVELLAVKEVVYLLGLGLFHRTRQLELAQRIVSDEIDVPDLDFLTPVDREIDPDGIGHHGILRNLDIYFGVVEALVCIVTLDDADRGTFDIFGEFTATTQMEPLFDILAVAVLDAGESPARNTRTLLDGNADEKRVAHGGNGIGINGDILEEVLRPQTIHRGRKVIARHLDGNARTKAGLLDDLIVAVIGIPFDRNSANYILFRVVVINLHRKALLRKSSRTAQEKDSSNQYLF